MTAMPSLAGEAGSTEPFFLEDFMVDPAARRICRGSTSRRLSPKAMGVLMALVEAAGDVVTRNALLDRVWPEVTVGEEVLTQAIAELRRALQDTVKQARFIETVHKAGYRLLVPPRRQSGTEPRAFAVPAVPQHQVIRFCPQAFETYGLFLEACVAFERGGARNTHDAAAKFYEVTQAQPDFAPAYAGLARSLAFIDMYYGPPGNHVARALEACEAGLRIDPACHDVLAAQGTAYSAAGCARQAYQSFNRALRLKPDCGATHYLLGRALFAEGEFTLSALMQEQAARLNPEDFHSLLLASKARRRLGDDVGARADVMKATLRIDQHLLSYPDDFRALCDKACCLVELGQKDTALALAEPLFEHSDPMAYYLVCFLARAGEIPVALERLDEIVEAGWSHAPVLQHDPDIDPLRGETRFQRIARRLELH